MPKRTDISSILIIGAGPIVIGQACEFDYSGTQACKALKAEGYRIVLVNSNPATIMTDPDLADATYIEPITPEIVAKIIAKERHAVPGGFALLPTMGGQTALNTTLSLRRMGVLEKYDVQMIGATAEAIDKAEDRKLFRQAMEKIGLSTPRSHQIKTLIQALQALDDIGLPAIIRPSFTLGGTGGGIAYNKEEFIEIVERGIDASPTSEVLIEELVLGWKEYEMEVVRDKNDNCIIVCSIENLDPMGVHTGDFDHGGAGADAHRQGISDHARRLDRGAARDRGGDRRLERAVRGQSGRRAARGDRDESARVALVGARLEGDRLSDRQGRRQARGRLHARRDPERHHRRGDAGIVRADHRLCGDENPALCVREISRRRTGADNLDEIGRRSDGDRAHLSGELAKSAALARDRADRPRRNRHPRARGGRRQERHPRGARHALARRHPQGRAGDAARHGRRRHSHGMPDRSVVPGADPRHHRNRGADRSRGLPTTASALRRLKAMGFSDARLGRLVGLTADQVAAQRRSLGVRPVFKRIDTCAAEFASPTAYMYSTYETPFAGRSADEAAPSNKKKVVILGGGPNRIGQGIEFDYCCCHAAFALKEVGYETIMVNCNPETVSTDYDTSDRLYFEPLTAEDVMEIIDTERKNGTLHGVIVQFGGQTPLKLAEPLEEAKAPILGTSPDAIDLAEDRDRFRELLDRLKLRQPKSGIATSPEKARAIADEIGYPIVIRPSYVLGGRAMEIVHDGSQIDRYLKRLTADLDRPSELAVSDRRPLLIDRYLTDAIEVDVDCLADGKDTYIAGIMEHIEEAGIHSGDSACSLPPHNLSADLIAELDRQTRALALALKVGGLMNVQYAIKDGVIYVLEVNPRASRTVPFVAKVTGVPAAKIAAQIMAGESLASFDLKPQNFEFATARHIGVKEAVFPFARFGDKVDTVLGPEMKSTGEVMGIDRDYSIAFAKSQLGGGTRLPKEGTVFVSVRDADKPRILDTVRLLAGLGFRVLATSGTQRYLSAEGVPAIKINKVAEGRPHIVDAIKNGGVQLVFNTTEGATALADSRSLRRAALLHKVPYYTTLSGAVAAAQGIKAYLGGDLEVCALQNYFAAATDPGPDQAARRTV